MARAKAPVGKTGARESRPATKAKGTFTSDERIIDSDAEAANSGDDVSTSSDDVSSDVSSEVSDDAVDKQTTTAPKETVATSASDTTTTTTTTTNNAPINFTPPSGFTKVNIDQASTSSTLKSSSLKSRQIWHITAPAAVPLSDMTSITMSDIIKQRTVLSREGSDYTLTEDKTISTKHLLLASASDGCYISAKVPCSKTLNLREAARIPAISKEQADLNRGSAAAANMSQNVIRAPKAQPKGLKMRYRPPGAGKGRIRAIGSATPPGGSDTETASRPTFRLPHNHTSELPTPDQSPQTTEKKRKADHSHGDDEDAETRLADKRARKAARAQKRESKAAKRASLVAQ